MFQTGQFGMETARVYTPLWRMVPVGIEEGPGWWRAKNWAIRKKSARPVACSPRGQNLSPARMPLSSGAFLALAGPLPQGSVPIHDSGHVVSRQSPIQGRRNRLQRQSDPPNPQEALILSATDAVNDAAVEVMCRADRYKAG